MDDPSHEGTDGGVLDDERFEAPLLAMRMMVAAWGLLNHLTPDQRGRAWAPLEHDERRDWDFIPKHGRQGLRLRDMDDRQKLLAHQLVASGLSLEGYSRVVTIMAHENTLRELNGPVFGAASSEFRHPEQYFLTVFGTPNLESTWGWRFVGHHVSLNFTVVRNVVAPTPLMLGAEPASLGTFAPLRDDEERGFALLGALDDDQRHHAVISPTAPANFVTRVVHRLGEEERPGHHELGFGHYTLTDEERDALSWHRHRPRGVSGRDLTPVQRELLRGIVEGYVARMPVEVAERHVAAVDGVGLEAFSFAWAGHTGPGRAHYYRVQGPSFLVEFDNAQDDGNHIHTVWRDPDNDFGQDLLARHYAEDHDAFHRDRTGS